MMEIRHNDAGRWPDRWRLRRSGLNDIDDAGEVSIRRNDAFFRRRIVQKRGWLDTVDGTAAGVQSGLDNIEQRRIEQASRDDPLPRAGNIGLQNLRPSGMGARSGRAAYPKRRVPEAVVAVMACACATLIAICSSCSPDKVAMTAPRSVPGNRSRTSHGSSALTFAAKTSGSDTSSGLSSPERRTALFIPAPAD
jgi:hypothetical protein